MVWCNIKSIDDSLFDDSNSKIVTFDYLGRESKTVVSSKVLEYLGIDSIEDYTQIFIVKSFVREKANYKTVFQIKKVR